MGIGDYFKTGEFWSNLEKTIKIIKKKTKQNSSHIKDLEMNNIILLEKVIGLNNSIDELRIEVKDLNRKLWDIKSEKVIYTNIENKKSIKSNNKIETTNQ